MTCTPAYSCTLCDFVTLDLLYIIQTNKFTKYEVWNFNSGNYLFTTDTK